MYFGRIISTLGLLLLITVVRGQQQSDSVLNRLITVQAVNQPVSKVLEQITAQYGIYFSFDASLINTDAIIPVNAENISVRNLLGVLFKAGEFHFIAKSSHIIISVREERETLPGLMPDSMATAFIKVTGKVVDNSTREPMSYVSISLKDKPIGTITNLDGGYILKLHPSDLNDTLIFSSLGYARTKRAVKKIDPDEVIALQSVSIRIREIKVKAVSIEEILENVREKISENYFTENKLLTGFYRETVKQDQEYINVSEAVLEILKAPANNPNRDDKVHLVKARRSPDVRPINWVNFKLQGGPYTITKLDAVKTMETFLDKEFEPLYRYSLAKVIWYKNHPVYVLRFRPVKNIDFPCFKGEIYVDRETYAILYAQFSLDEYGMDMAGESLIRKKPRGFKVKPLNVDYQVDYFQHQGKWVLHMAQASIAFRIKSRKDEVNSVFSSTSELLVTDVKQTDLKRFPIRELFSINDIFADLSVNYDENFWEQYNIIKPEEELQNAIRNFVRIPTSEIEK